jgi:hypothetical protein
VPFKSEAQRRYLWAKEPAVAKEWAAHTPKGTKLPQHVKAGGQTRQPKGQGGGGRFAGYTASPLVRQTRKT